MNYSVKKQVNPAQEAMDCIVIPVFAENHLSDAAKQIDDASSSGLSDFLKRSDFTGKKGEIETLYQLKGIASKRVMLVGCGKQKKYDIEALTSHIKACAAILKKTSVKTMASWLGEGIDDQEQVARESILALSTCYYRFDHYKSKKEDDDDDISELDEVVIIGTDNTDALNQSAGIAQGVELAKNLANHPGNVCTPTYLAKTAKELADEFDSLTLEVLEEADMEALGMGSFLSVSRGSQEDGKMIVLQYNGAGDDKPVALVGKGITFDTGGISLKPGARMDEMKFDMGGAASVIGTVRAIAAMKLPINLVAVVASAENMPGSIATKPGDIVTSMSGKTIEVLNTDAEGRLVLCDALTYVKKYDPAIVIDIATLTGACIVALGHHISALISNDDQLADDILQAGEDCLDEAWRLPMNAKYKKQLKSEFADLGNIAAGGAGTITAACFLAEFTGDYTWAHLDIAGTAWKGKAATGRPVPLLSQYLINYSQK